MRKPLGAIARYKAAVKAIRKGHSRPPPARVEQKPVDEPLAPWWVRDHDRNDD